jgi:hypothetical protein
VHGGITLKMLDKFYEYSESIDGIMQKNANFFEACNFVFNEFLRKQNSQFIQLPVMSNFLYEIIYNLTQDRSLSDVDAVRDIQVMTAINSHNYKYGLDEVSTIVIGHTPIAKPLVYKVLQNEWNNYAIMLGDTAMSAAFQTQSDNPQTYYEQHIHAGKINFKTGERVFLSYRNEDRRDV